MNCLESTKSIINELIALLIVQDLSESYIDVNDIDIVDYYDSFENKDKFLSYDFSNQPYNYTHKKFLEKNEY